MITVTLRPMTDDEFRDWFARSSRNFAADRMRAFGHTADAAQADVDTAARRMLPEGRATAGHDFSRVIEGGVLVGWLWLGTSDDGALWIYDIEIEAAQRGRGIGTATLRAAEVVARARGANAIALNVFGHNPRARALYESVGFETVSTEMRKPLAD